MFEPPEGQELLAETVRRLLAASESRTSAETWEEMAELGLLGMAFPDGDCGLNGATSETMAVMRELGRGLYVSPFLSSAVLASYILAHPAAAAEFGALRQALALGHAVTAFAYAEEGTRYKLAQVAARATITDGGIRLNGRKVRVADGGEATHFVVSARTSESEDESGTTLLVVPASAAGVERRAYATADGGEAADVAFANVLLPPSAEIRPNNGAFVLIEAALDRATVAAVSEAVGAMEALFELTLDCLKTRRQFGVPIGSFQVLQHAAAAMFVEVEQARSMALYATDMLSARPQMRRSAVAAAKLHTNRTARFVGETAVQLHGGIGLTAESAAGRLFRKLAMFRISFGDDAHCFATLDRDPAGILAA